MKYKVLLLLILATLAYSRSLKKTKTRQGYTHILDFEKYQAGVLQNSLVFCTDDQFEQYNDFNRFLSDDKIFERKLEEVKFRVAQLEISLYYLETGNKVTFFISELEKPFEYSLEEGTWQIKIKGVPKPYIVRSRFDIVDLDFASEIIVFNYHIAVLLHFKLQGKEAIEIFNSLENVYKSFLYTPVIHKFYENLILNVDNTKVFNKGLFNPLTKLFDKLKLNSYAAKDLRLKVIDSKDKLMALQSLLNSSTELNIDALRIIFDIHFSRDPELAQHTLVLAKDVAKLTPELRNYLKFIISMPNNFFINFFKYKLTTFEEFSLLKQVLRLKLNERSFLVKYMNIYKNLKKVIVSKNCGQFKVNDILAHKENAEMLSEFTRGDDHKEPEALLIQCVKELANDLENAVKEFQKLEVEKKGDSVRLIVENMKRQSDMNESFILSLIDLLSYGAISNKIANENLEEISLIFNNEVLRLNESRFQTVKELLYPSIFGIRILNAYELINTINLAHYVRLMKNIKFQGYIEIVFLAKELELNVLKTITSYLLDDRNNKIFEELISNIKQLGSVTSTLRITFKEALILDKILLNENLGDFQKRLNNYLKEVGILGFKMRDFDGFRNLEYIEGSKGFLKYVLKRLEPLMKHFVKNIMAEKQVMGIEKIIKENTNFK
jgi:hypothetical protein